MTEDEKNARRAIIAARSESRTTSPARAGTATYWLTRARINGDLAPLIDVWISKPDRHRLDDGDAFWFSEGPDGNGGWYAKWSLYHAWNHVRFGIPEDDRQCLRVDGDYLADSIAEVSYE